MPLHPKPHIPNPWLAARAQAMAMLETYRNDIPAGIGEFTWDSTLSSAGAPSLDRASPSLAGPGASAPLSREPRIANAKANAKAAREGGPRPSRALAHPRAPSRDAARDSPRLRSPPGSLSRGLPAPRMSAPPEMALSFWGRPSRADGRWVPFHC